MKSSWKVKDGTAGDWTLTPGKWFGDAKADAGIQTGPDARFFAIGAPFKKPVDTDGKTLVLQVRTRKPRARCTEPLADQPGSCHRQGTIAPSSPALCRPRPWH